MVDELVYLDKISEDLKKLMNCNGKIAIYGYNDFTKKIISEGKLNLFCVVDDDFAGNYIEGYYVISVGQLYDFDIDALVLSCTFDNLLQMYNAVKLVCRKNNVKIYDIHGINCSGLDIMLETQKIGMYNRDISMMNDAVMKCDVVLVSLEKTFFHPKDFYFSNFFKRINRKMLRDNINIFDFSEKINILKERDPYTNSLALIDIMTQEDSCQEYLSEIVLLFIHEVVECFKAREEIVRTIEFARQNGKRIVFVGEDLDYRIPSYVWGELFKFNGFGDAANIYTASELWKATTNGLLEHIVSSCGHEEKYLYISGNTDSLLYGNHCLGMDIFYYPNAADVFNAFEERASYLDVAMVRETFEEYLMKVYKDSVTKTDILRERICNGYLREKLFTEMQRAYEGKREDDEEPITNRPQLFDLPNNIDECAKIEFDEYDEPSVSIVIPVYNQFAYTYNALKSIHERTCGISYEIIIADDCSSDEVSHIEDWIKGVTIIHNKENKKFLLNCNSAACLAKGKYILFLNNDTQVQEEWLDSLIELIESSDDIGMVGSKLVYPDGRLQEAGGILWDDASAWNFGNLKNPESPIYNYVKEVDYISGAAIMIKAELWNEIGGFDVNLTPAYYEDTDLAFSVRSKGYKVVYQPKSVVVHFEGVSNGTDVTTGQKAYQILNRRKFYEKWHDELKNHHFENGTSVFLAKDRGQFKKQILVVDHYVPNFDKDAGGRCTFMYLKAFIEMGLKVTFIGDNFASPEPYSTVLRQMGVEILSGDYYYVHWQEWLKENLKYFDYVYLQRPHISIKYIDLVKQYSNAKIFYFAHDLHHVRFLREYEITGDNDTLQEAERWKKVEYELFEKADVGHVVGSFEQNVVQKLFPNMPIRNIPLYLYNTMPNDIEKDFSNREDIVFVGGFAHSPNLDAVIWFANEVYPRILEEYPNMVWHIVGSKVPREVQKLSGKNIIIEGFLPDAELEKLYRKCKLAVVPLRYGAGVKGKIVEAAYFQIPIITTSVGGEGIDDSYGAFLMCDEAADMARTIIKIYSDNVALNQMSNNCYKLIKRNYSFDEAKRILQLDL